MVTAVAPPVVNTSVVKTPIWNEAQDSRGQILANNNSKLSRWNGTQWVVSYSPPDPFFKLEGLTRQDDGALLGVWLIEIEHQPTECLVTEHRGRASRVLARFKNSELNSPVSAFRDAGNTWLISGGSCFFRLKNGTAHLVYKIAATQRPPVLGDGNSGLTEWLYSAADGEGRRLFWGTPQEWFTAVTGLRGLLMWSGGQWKYWKQIPGMPDKPLSGVVPLGKHTFWVAVRDSGLFLLDTRTMTSRRVKEPMPYAFANIQRIFFLEGYWHVITNSPETQSPHGDYAQRDDDLWRLEKLPQDAPPQTHDWHRLLRGLDYGQNYGSGADRPVLATAAGWWLGAAPGGLWWLPRPGAPQTGGSKQGGLPDGKGAIRLDWRQGFTFRTVDALYQCPDGKVAAIAYGLGMVPDTRPFLSRPAAPNPVTFTTYGLVNEDSRHHLWRIPSVNQRSLLEWDGYRWLNHVVPTSFKMDGVYCAEADSRGRIWLEPDEREGQVAQMDIARGSWKVFPTMTAALRAEPNISGAGALPKLTLGSDDLFNFQFASGGRLAYRAPSDKLFYFDGKIWHQWTPSQISGQEKRLSAWEGRPAFDKNGVLIAFIGLSLRKWRPATGWKSYDPDDPKEYAPVHSEGEPSVQPPAYAPFKDPRSTIRDRNGVIWMTKDGQLYKAAYGICLPQLRPGRLHPFNDGRQLSKVWLDSRGRGLLGTDAEWSYELVFEDLPAPPETKIVECTRTGHDLAAQFVASGPGKHWFRHRLDGGAWSNAESAGNVAYTNLLAGTHILEVAALDEHLQLDPSPARQSMAIEPSGEQELAQLIRRLQSPDFNEREAAIKILALEPAQAGPALKAACDAASETEQWWLDAAIQQVERQKSSALPVGHGKPR